MKLKRITITEFKDAYHNSGGSQYWFSYHTRKFYTHKNIAAYRDEITGDRYLIFSTVLPIYDVKVAMLPSGTPDIKTINQMFANVEDARHWLKNEMVPDEYK